MRVTNAVRTYVNQVLQDKVKDQKQVAEKAAEKAEADRDAKIEAALKKAGELVEETHEKFSKWCASKLGLTWIKDVYDYKGRKKPSDIHLAFKYGIDKDNFVETTTTDHNKQHYPSTERDEFERVIAEAARIEAAANRQAEKLLFDLELGKLAKKELDDILNEMEVEI